MTQTRHEPAGGPSRPGAGGRDAGRSLRVAFVLEQGTGGGIQHAIPRIAAGLADRGHAVDVLCLHARFSYTGGWGPRPADAGGVRMWTLHEVEAAGVRYPRVRGPVRGLLKTLRAGAVHAAGRAMAALRLAVPHPALLAWIEREKPDVVFGCDVGSNAVVLATCPVAGGSPRAVPMLRGRANPPAGGPRAAGRPAGGGGRAGWKRRVHLRTATTAVLLRAAPVIVSVSRALAREEAAATGIRESRVRVIPNPYDFDRIAALAEEEPAGWPDDGLPVLVNVARLEPEKGQDTLILAAAELAARRRPARLLILGDGTGLAGLRRTAREAGVEELVGFRGWVANPFPYMRRADAFVLSSRFEGRPNVVIEALACGCPVVTTAFAGVDEVADGGRLARVAPVGDPSALADAIAATLREGRGGGGMRAAAVRERYDPDAALRAYEEAAGEAAAAPGPGTSLAAVFRAAARGIAAWGPRFRERDGWPTAH